MKPTAAIRYALPAELLAEPPHGPRWHLQASRRRFAMCRPCSLRQCSHEGSLGCLEVVEKPPRDWVCECMRGAR